MSNAFDDREKAFEAKYRLDQETEFKVTVRRDKLLGLWAAEQMGMTGAEAEAYARGLVDLELSPGQHDIVARVAADLAARKADVSPEKLSHQAQHLHAQARTQIARELGQQQQA